MKLRTDGPRRTADTGAPGAAWGAGADYRNDRRARRDQRVTSGPGDVLRGGPKVTHLSEPHGARPRRGTTSSPTTNGAPEMVSSGEVKQAASVAIDKANEALEALQKAVQDLNEALATFTAASDGSDRSQADEGKAALAQAASSAEEAQQAAAAGIAAAEEFRDTE